MGRGELVGRLNMVIGNLVQRIGVKGCQCTLKGCNGIALDRRIDIVKAHGRGNGPQGLPYQGFRGRGRGPHLKVL